MVENLKSLFIDNEYAIVKELNSTWDESSYSFFYSLYKHPYLSKSNRSIASSINLFSNDNTYNGTEKEILHQQFVEDLFKFIVEGLGLSFITILGIFGNILSFIILSKKSMKSKSINRLLIGLSVCDLVFICGVLYSNGIPNICAYYQSDFSKYLMLVPISYPLSITAHTGSVYFTVAVTAERYFVVAYPFRARVICTPRRAVYISIIIATFSTLYNIPRWWEYSYTAVLNEHGDLISYLPLTTEFRRNPTYHRYYYRIAFFVLLVGIPMIVLIVLNVLIYKTVQSAKSNRKFLTTKEEKENSLAIMLVVVVTVFLICNSLSFLNLIVKLHSGLSNIYQFDSIRNFALIFNSSINFIIYFAYGKKFRCMVFAMLPSWIVVKDVQGGGGFICCGKKIDDGDELESRQNSNNNNIKKSIRIWITKTIDTYYCKQKTIDIIGLKKTTQITSNCSNNDIADKSSSPAIINEINDTNTTM